MSAALAARTELCTEALLSEAVRLQATRSRGLWNDDRSRETFGNLWLC